MRDTCLFCGQTVARINYAMGPEWMHIDPAASFPTQHKGTAWRYCRAQIATPKEALDA